MKAIRIHNFGGTDVLCHDDVPVPICGENEILIRVRAAGVNPVDTKIRAGKFLRFTPRLPAILGRDVSGEVVAAGRSVDGFSTGDSVFGMLDYDRGAYAEFAIATPREIAKASAALDPRTLAALPVAALTAWQVLFEHGKLRPGQRVLIHAAHGGVGHFAVQFARNCGAEVIATCSAPHLDLVRDLGAAEAIDYKTQQFEDRVQNVDLVVDLIGGETRKRSWETLKPGGILVSTLPDPKPSQRTDVSGREAVVYPSSAQLGTIAELLGSGGLRVELDRTFPLSEAHLAHHHLEEERSFGKTVLFLERVMHFGRAESQA